MLGTIDTDLKDAGYLFMLDKLYGKERLIDKIDDIIDEWKVSEDAKDVDDLDDNTLLIDALCRNMYSRFILGEKRCKYLDEINRYQMYFAMSPCILLDKLRYASKDVLDKCIETGAFEVLESMLDTITFHDGTHRVNRVTSKAYTDVPKSVEREWYEARHKILDTDMNSALSNLLSLDHPTYGKVWEYLEECFR